MSEALKRNTPYSVEHSTLLHLKNWRNIRAVWTGEKRQPQAGEWYLSGAEICAYRAVYDMTCSYHIAKLIRTETKTITTIIGDLEQ